MLDLLINFFNHSFMVYALIIGIFLGLGASLLSSFLVLNKQAMIADGLSHVAFTGIIFGVLITPNQPIYIAIPIAALAAILITYLGNLKLIEHDASIGVVSAFVLAVGLITVSLAKGGFNQSIESLLTGSILSSSLSDVIIAVIAFIVVLAFILLFYRKLLLVSYDPLYASFAKVKQQMLSYLLAVLVSVFIVIGVRIVGMLLISAFIIYPALIASQLSKSFKQTLIFSVICAFVGVSLGIFTSYFLDLPTGSTIVVIYTIFLVISLVYRKLSKCKH